MKFLIDEYDAFCVYVYTDCATFQVLHNTEINSEDEFDDCWSYATDSHYTRSTGRKSWYAITEIKSIQLMLDENNYTDVNLNDGILRLIEAAIEKSAVSFVEATQEAA